MEGHRISLLVLAIITVTNGSATTKEVRTAGLPEKIIGGVIDLVQSHKNKPTNQPTYPNTPGYQPQYPQYQQWNGQNYQGQGFNYQGQYQNQGQYAGQYPAQYPSNTNYGTGQVYPTPPSGFNNGQTQSQGQYQIVYQNPPSGQGQYTPSTGQYQNNQQTFQNQQTNLQTQQTGNYQGQNTGNYQQTTGSFQGQNTGNYQGQNGFQTQGVTQSESAQHGQGFQTGSQGSNSGGPTCVCQAWTKPSEILNDPIAEKTEKINNEPAN